MYGFREILRICLFKKDSAGVALYSYLKIGDSCGVNIKTFYISTNRMP